MSVVPPSVSPAFQRAGWFEGRSVPVDTAVPRQHPGYSVLAELGGICLDNPAPSVCSIDFKHVDSAAGFVAPWEDALGTKMVGIAEQDDGHAELYLTERGQVIGCSLVHRACWLVGQSFQSAMEALTRGDQSQPMLLPDEDTVRLFGTVYKQGDGQVLGPADLA